MCIQSVEGLDNDVETGRGSVFSRTAVGTQVANNVDNAA